MTVDDDDVAMEDVVEMALEGAVRRLAERGHDANNYSRLCTAIVRAAEQLMIAKRMSLDEFEYRRYLDALYDRLDAGVVVDDISGLEPPRRTLRRA